MTKRGKRKKARDSRILLFSLFNSSALILSASHLVHDTENDNCFEKTSCIFKLEIIILFTKVCLYSHLFTHIQIKKVFHVGAAFLRAR